MRSGDLPDLYQGPGSRRATAVLSVCMYVYVYIDTYFLFHHQDEFPPKYA